MKAKPYVGITGPVNTFEVESICKKFRESGYSMGSPHIPMLGFLVSYKTLNNLPTANKRYPQVHVLRDLLAETQKDVLTMVHYNTKEMPSLAGQVAQIFDGIYQNKLCRALQMNIIWPDVRQVRAVREKFPEMQIVFQASHKAMENKSPKEIIAGIGEYGDTLDYVLIDPSGGRGLEFDIEQSLAVYSELREKLPDLTVGFAGGFNGRNVDTVVEKLIAKLGSTDFCIDAEGGLRDKISEEYGDDILNIDSVRRYLQKASLVLK